MARGSLRDGAQTVHGEGRLERRLLERARREAVPDLLDDEPERTQRPREAGHWNTSVSEDEEVCLDALLLLAGEDVPQLDSAGRRRHQLSVVADLDPRSVEPLQIEVAPVLVDALADRD